SWGRGPRARGGRFLRNRKAGQGGRAQPPARPAGEEKKGSHWFNDEPAPGGSKEGTSNVEQPACARRGRRLPGSHHPGPLATTRPACPTLPLRRRQRAHRHAPYRTLDLCPCHPRRLAAGRKASPERPPATVAVNHPVARAARARSGAPPVLHRDVHRLAPALARRSTAVKEPASVR